MRYRLPARIPSPASVVFPRDLAHPETIRVGCDSTDLDFSKQELDEEQHHEPLQAFPGPDFNREEVCRHNRIPVLRQKLFPAPLPFPVRCRLDSLSLQNLGNRAAGEFVTKIGQSALDATVAPSPDFPLPFE